MNYFRHIPLYNIFNSQLSGVNNGIFIVRLFSQITLVLSALFQEIKSRQQDFMKVFFQLDSRHMQNNVEEDGAWYLLS